MVRSPCAHAGLIAIALVGCADPPVMRVVSGAEHVCALEVGQTPRCWGADRFGQLATSGDAFGPSIDVGAGGASTCAVDHDGEVRCAGFNNHGQLGDGTLEPRASPVRVSDIPAAVEVSVGFAHACARTEEGAVYCWGWSSLGQAIPGLTGDAPPSRVDGLPPVERVVAGYTHTCGLEASGAAHCWGERFGGGVERVGDDVRAVAIGVDHLCFVTPGAVRCVGNEPGGARPSLPDEGRVFAIDATIAAGGIDHACFGGAEGARCVGKNMNGQLGSGQMGDVATEPAAVRDLGGPIEDLAVGDRHSCAVSGGQIVCWGWNDVGQLGDDSGVHSLVPQPVPL